MSTIATSEEPGARLQEALTSWATHLAPGEVQDSRYQAAFEAIDPRLGCDDKIHGRRQSWQTSGPEPRVAVD
jgi:hypothetical protein